MNPVTEFIVKWQQTRYKWFVLSVQRKGLQHDYRPSIGGHRRSHTRMLEQSTWLVVGCKVCRLLLCRGARRNAGRICVLVSKAGTTVTFPCWRLHLSSASAFDCEHNAFSAVIVCYIPNIGPVNKKQISTLKKKTIQTFWDSILFINKRKIPFMHGWRKTEIFFLQRNVEILGHISNIYVRNDVLPCILRHLKLTASHAEETFIFWLWVYCIYHFL